MRVPKRKGGRRTFKSVDPYLTPAKFEELKMELQRLKEMRAAAVAEVKRLGELGDFSENAAYGLAKGRLRWLNQRLFELEKQIKQAIILRSPSDKSYIQLGHRVTVETNGLNQTYLILGPEETNPTLGIISYKSPLGTALLGRKVGDEVIVDLGGRKVVYKIIKIE